MTSAKTISTQDVSASKGEDAERLAQQAAVLVQGRWSLCNGGKALERDFKFKTFKATWVGISLISTLIPTCLHHALQTFMNSVAEQCKVTRHHPEWSNVYNKTSIRWTTHNPEGLSSKDIDMAKFCDQAADECGELPPSPENGEDKAV